MNISSLDEKAQEYVTGINECLIKINIRVQLNGSQVWRCGRQVFFYLDLTTD